MSRQSPPRTRSQLHRAPPESSITASLPAVRPTTRSMSLKRKYEVAQPSTVKRKAEPVTSIDSKAPRSRGAQNQMKKPSPLHSASTDVNIKSQNSGGRRDNQHSNFLCGICFNYKPLYDMFKNDKCNHAFCFACMAKHVTSQINQNFVKVTCPHPNCSLEQTPISVFLIFVKKVIELGTALCESTNSVKHKYEVGQPSTVKRRTQPIASIDAKAPNSGAQNQMKKQSPLHGASADVNIKSQNIGGSHSNFLCGICFDYKPLSDMFKNDKCDHAFCSACMAKYVTSQINQNIVKVTCPHPNCYFEQNPQSLHPILPRKVIEKWDTAICESTVSASHKTYCPFKDCSVLLVKDRGEVVTRCECPSCHRLFCAQCRVPWHARVTSCEEFQRMKKRSYVDQDLDKKFFKLAKDENWRKCPYCNMFVQRDGGCEHIACRCGGDFCYYCGKNWAFGHMCKN
ncbi:unnamed protein product [Cuscuta europaea]|uniref:RBR-type E3 ubiquitin transferase n=1 Tax=Cuscuta europaea TaxID=41803 RepID=A0A9P1E0E0_CUSEU|nr:unnamed protein product [Cuscuta europaea]